MFHGDLSSAEFFDPTGVSRGNRTPVELFADGASSFEATIQQLVIAVVA